jgi:predicted transcriptional regulator
MAKARDIRAAVRAQHAATLKARETAAITVAAALDKVEETRDRLIQLEQEAAAAINEATAHLTIADLAAIIGADQRELRRLARHSAPAGQTELAEDNEQDTREPAPAHVPAPRPEPEAVDLADDVLVSGQADALR